ncbi:MAG: hypothetical protein ACKPKO_18600, partial [Candidatus Fonsibacter sp.]
LKGIKHLLALKHKHVLDCWSKYRANKCYSEELASFVNEIQKDIDMNDRILEEEGHSIEQLQDASVALKRELKETYERLNTTKKLLESTQRPSLEDTDSKVDQLRRTESL